jgi:hypothetical protein
MLNLLKDQAKKQLARAGYSLKSINELTYLADMAGSDKGTRSNAHMYTRIYERFFEKIRNKDIAILEIGLCRSDADQRRMQCAAEGETTSAASRAPSLEMWRTYFPKARLFGFDIDDFSKVKIDRCRIIRGDMSSRDDLAKVSLAVGGDLDVIIEDGSHASHHQQIALGSLLPHVRPGGLYIVEDLHWQDERLEKQNAPKTRDILRRFQATGVFESPFLTEAEQKYVQENVERVWLFDSLSNYVSDASDAVAVLQKK